MPLPSKQEDLYKQVQKDLESYFKTGKKLPTEPLYAKELKCGRTTLRKVLNRLSNERKILRTPRGTYVLDLKTGAAICRKKTERPVYLLIPCADYNLRIGDRSLHILRQVISGVMRGTIECGRQFVTLPISENNRTQNGECSDIAWTQVSILRENDDVLFFGHWYNGILPYLAQNNCHVACVAQDMEMFRVPGSPWEIQNGFVGYNIPAFMQKSLSLLQSSGKKRTACFFASRAEQEQAEIKSIYTLMLKQFGMQGVFYKNTENNAVQVMNRLLREQTEKIDSLIICPHNLCPNWNRTSLNIPGGIAVICDGENPVPQEKYGMRTGLYHNLAYNIRILVHDFLNHRRKIEWYPYREEKQELDVPYEN